MLRIPAGCSHNNYYSVHNNYYQQSLLSTDIAISNIIRYYPRRGALFLWAKEFGGAVAATCTRFSGALVPILPGFYVLLEMGVVAG